MQIKYLPFCIVENRAPLARSGACGTAGDLFLGAKKHIEYETQTKNKTHSKMKKHKFEITPFSRK